MQSLKIILKYRVATACIKRILKPLWQQTFKVDPTFKAAYKIFSFKKLNFNAKQTIQLIKSSFVQSNHKKKVLTFYSGIVKSLKCKRNNFLFNNFLKFIRFGFKMLKAKKTFFVLRYSKTRPKYACFICGLLSATLPLHPRL